jgi:hypothetical protein
MGSPGDIAAMLGKRREAARNPEPATPERAGAANEPTSQEGDAEPETAPGESETYDETLDPEPPVEPPRTWTKAEKEAFRNLPREHQMAVAQREMERDAHYQRGLQDAAARQQAAQAREQAAEQARQRYEQALPVLLQQFQAQVAGQFQDIKTWDDVREMQKNDPMRYMEWDAAIKQTEALKQQAAEVQRRQQEQYQHQYREWLRGQIDQFSKAAPEYFDAEKSPKLWADLRSELVETGISEQEVNHLMNGGSIPFHDHRTLILLRDAMKYRAAQKALKAAKPKSVPPVQKPGTPTPRAAVSEQVIRDLTAKMKDTGAPRDIAALLTARRKAAAS